MSFNALILINLISTSPPTVMTLGVVNHYHHFSLLYQLAVLNWSKTKVAAYPAKLTFPSKSRSSRDRKFCNFNAIRSINRVN